MNKYVQGYLYIGNIKINNTTIKENAILFYDKEKDIFYTIEVLNHLLDQELNKSLNEQTKKEIEDIIKKNSYPHFPENNNDIKYISEESISLFTEKTKAKNK